MAAAARVGRPPTPNRRSGRPERRRSIPARSGPTKGSQAFAVKLPNADTREALRQAHEHRDLIEYDGMEELKAAHD